MWADGGVFRLNPVSRAWRLSDSFARKRPYAALLINGLLPDDRTSASSERANQWRYQSHGHRRDGGDASNPAFGTKREPLRELQEENAELEWLLADAHLDLHALKSVLGVKRWPHGSRARRSAGWSENTACPSAARAVSWGSPANRPHDGTGGMPRISRLRAPSPATG